MICNHKLYMRKTTFYCLEMLRLLSSGQRMKISDIASYLSECGGEEEISARRIIEFRRELESLGYEIETYSGKDGGYQLKRGNLLPVLCLKHEDKDALLDAYAFALSKPDFINKFGYIKTMGKVFSSFEIETEESDLVATNKTDSNISHEKIAENYKAVLDAIEKKLKLKIKYAWLKEPVETLIVEPYQLFLIDNEWRFFAYIKSRGGEPIPLKLSRILEYELTKEKYAIDPYFKIDKYVKDGILLKNGKMFTITLIASGPRGKLFKEKRYGLNQSCEDLPDGTVKVTLDMQENYSTYNFILGCGELVEVVEPEWLREKIKELASNIINRY